MPSSILPPPSSVPTPPSSLLLTGVTDIGRKREVNEDGFALCPDLSTAHWSQTPTQGFVDLPAQGAMLIVADGMGGAAAGDVASRIAIDTLTKRFTAVSTQQAPLTTHTLRTAIAEANDAIVRHVDTAPETAGMATTIVVAWVTASQAVVAWCGDSRCYLYRPGKGLQRVSHDHSYVQQLVDAGEITEEEALTHPKSNIITSCLGDTGISPETDITVADMQPGDLLLLCSDGLCGYCSDGDIESILNRYHDDPPVCQEALLQAALDTGGHDNITIAIAALASAPPSAPQSSLKTFFHRLLGGTFKGK